MLTMKFEIGSMSVAEFFNIADQIDCNPIHQRLSRDDDKFTKSKGIIKTLLNGMSIGQITIHTLPEDSEYRYESIDGGHRKRAIISFLRNEFSVKLNENDLFWKDFSEEQRESFRNLSLSFCVYNNIDPVEVGNIFRVLNTITKISDQEILNSYGDHPIANAIREIVRIVPSVNNTYHPMFEPTLSKTQPFSWWHSFDNTGLRQDEWVARIFYRYYVGGGVGEADADNLRLMYDDSSFDQKTVDSINKKVYALLRFVHIMAQHNKKFMGKGLTQNVATMFSRLYLSLESQYKNWSMNDSEVFYQAFISAHKELSEEPSDPDSPMNKPAPMDKAVAMWSWYKAQYGYQKSTEAAISAINMLLEKVDIESLITVKDAKRAFSSTQKESKLALQNFKCAVTGKILTMKDAHGDHIVPHSKGGKTEVDNLQMIAANVNLAKSDMTMEEFMPTFEVKREMND